MAAVNLNNFKLKMSFGIILEKLVRELLPSCAVELSLGNVCLGKIVRELAPGYVPSLSLGVSLRNFTLGVFADELSLGNFSLGAFSWELLLRPLAWI